MPGDSDSILVKVHIDYQIDRTDLTEEEVDSFVGFGYTFTVKVYASIFGVRSVDKGGKGKNK